MNPSVNKGACDNLLTGGNYCVKQVKKKIVKNVVGLKTSTNSSPGRTKVSKKRKSSKKRKATTTRGFTKKITTSKKAIPKKTTTTKKTTTKRTTTSKKTTTKKTTTITTTTKKATTTTKKESPTSTSSSEKRKLLQKGSDLTYYWIAHPDDYDHKGKDVTVKTCDGKSLGTVSEEYADALVMEGTGIIDDKVINLGGCTCSNYKCFMEVDKKEDPFGLTGKNCNSLLYDHF